MSQSSPTYSQLKRWEKKVPVRACPDCYKSKHLEKIHSMTLTCSTCSGKGTVRISRMVDTSIINQKIKANT